MRSACRRARSPAGLEETRRRKVWGGCFVAAPWTWYLKKNAAGDYGCKGLSVYEKTENKIYIAKGGYGVTEKAKDSPPDTDRNLYQRRGSKYNKKYS
jgi:hypothetical protein